MFESDEELNLSKLIDVNFLQKFQDAFADTMGVASITVDNKGPITKPSNFTDFCIKFTRTTAEGFRRCNDCDIKWGKLAAIKQEPVIYKCHTGLTDFAVPIIVNGQHIGSILGGQVLTKKPDEMTFREIARQIGIDEDEYIEALKKIKVISSEHVKNAAELLFLVANAISEIGLQNLKLIKKTKRDNLYKEIMETIRTSLDVDETKQKIVNIIGKTLKADRCFVIEYDQNTDKFSIVNDEYLSSDNIPHYKGTDANVDVPNFMKELKKGNYIVVDNKKIYVNDKPMSFDIEDDTIKRIKVNSAYGIPLFYNKELQGVLGIHYIAKKHSPNQDEIDLLKDVAEQLAISIYQANLYKKIQLQSERESLYRSIMETIRTSLDIDETKQKIVNIIGKTLNADRCFIAEYNKEADKFLIIKDEYLSSDAIIPYKGSDPEEDVPNFVAILKRGKPLIVNNKEIIFDGDGLSYEQERNAIEKYDVSSFYAIPIYYYDEMLGVLSIHYVKEHAICGEEINLITTIAGQIAIAIHQANLYKKNQINAQREKVISSVISKIISTFDINQIKQMVSDIGIVTKADRCYFVEVDIEKMKGKPIDYDGEYLASSDVKSIIGYDFPTEDVEMFLKIFLEAKDLVVFDYENIPELQSEPYAGVKRYSEMFQLKNSIAMPFYYMGKLTAVLVIEYVKEKIIPSEDDLEFLRILGNQVGTAFSQIQLYNTMKQTTANQNAILNNMPFMVWLKDAQSVLLAANERYAQMCNTTVENLIGKTDFDFFPKEHAESYVREDRAVMETKQTIPSEDLIMGPEGARWHETFKSPVFDDRGNVIGTTGLSRDITDRKELEISIVESKNRLNAILNNIPYWAWLKDVENKYILVNKQYAQDKNLTVESFIGKTDYDVFPEEMAKAYIKDDQSVIDSGESRTIEEKTIVNGGMRYLETYKQPFFNSSGTIIGTVGIAKDVTENKEAELELLRRQEEIIKANEREALLRRITETIRSSLNLDETLLFICEEIAKIFNVQRSAIVSFPNPKNIEVYDIKKEYKSSDKIKGLDEVVDITELSKYWGEVLINKGLILAIDNIEESDASEAFKNIYTSLGIKSIIGIPIKKGKTVWGNLVLSEYNNYRHWIEEEKTLLSAVSNQIYLAINQAELYENEKKIAERETILRKIIEAIRSSLDITKVKKNIAYAVGKAFGADRCYFRSYDKLNNKFLPVDVEYLASSDIPSLLGLEPDQQALGYFADEIRKHKDGFYPIVADQKFVQNTPLENFIKFLGSKVDYVMPIINKQDELSWIVLHYQKEDPKFTDEEKKLLETIAYQIDIAFEQIRLFEIVKKTAEREMLLRDIIEKIRSSLDIDETLSFICEEAAKLFNIQRSAITSFPTPGNYEDYIVRKEYKISPEIKGFNDIEDFSKPTAYWVHSLVKSNKVLAYDNISDADIPEYFRKPYVSIGIKALIGVAIRKGKDVWGTLVLSEYSEPRQWTIEEKTLLNTIADQVYIAVNQAELFEREKKAAEREMLIREVVSKVSSTLDINEIIHTFVFEIGKILDAQKVFFSKYDELNNTLLTPDENAEYVESPNTLKYKDMAAILDNDFPAFCEQIKSSKEMMLITDVAKFFRDKGMEDNINFESTRKYNFNSAIAFPIVSQGKLLGFYGIEYEKSTNLNQPLIDLLTTLAEQTAIAMKQANLYQNEKKTSERETLVRNIIETIRSTLDINKMKKQIVTEIGKSFNAERCIIHQTNQKTGKFEIIDEFSEYKSMENLVSYIGIDIENQNLSFFRDMFSAGKEMIAPNWPEYLASAENINEDTKKWLESLDIKSNYVFPIMFQNKLLAVFYMTYTQRYEHLSESDLSAIRLLTNQIAIALNQAELYQKEKMTAEVEKTLREVMLSSVSTFDVSEVIASIVKEAGMLFDADRCFFAEFNSQTNSILPVLGYTEYVSSDDIRLVMDRQPTTAETEVFINDVKKKKTVFVDDIAKVELPDITKNMLVEGFSVKSYGIIPVFYGDIIYGALVLHYVNNYKHFGQNEIDISQAFANQSAIVLHQAQLFKQTQLQAEREKVIREIISEVSSTLDFNQIRKSLVNNLGNVLGSDFDILYLKDPNTDKFLPIDEYSVHLSSEEIENPVGMNLMDIYDWADYFLSGKMGDLVYSDVEDFKRDNNLYGTMGEQFLNKYNIKSCIVTMIKHAGVLLGVLGINFTKAPRILTEDEINLVRTVAYQAGIALNQANLYRITQVQAEREKISKNIVEILRSSMDKKTIKRQFVKNIGKFFGADRVFFSDYDLEQKMYLPVDEFSEYLSSPDEKSFVGYDWSDESVSEYIQPLLEKREVKISCWDEYIKENQKGQGFISLFMDANVKSSYSLPVLYQDKIMGYFCISFTRNACHRLTDEDINRIRSMCTQAGIALYHADLYVKAQESLQSKEEFIAHIANGSRAILNNIVEISDAMSKTEAQCDKHIEHLNHINENVTQLLDFTNKIIDKSKPNNF